MVDQEAINILNLYRNRHYSDSSISESYKIANAINVILPEYIRLNKIHQKEKEPCKFCEDNFCFWKSELSGYFKETDIKFCPHCGRPLEE